MSTTTIAEIESGKTLRPHLETLERLRDALQARGIQFKPGGWVRHCDDANGDTDDGDGADEPLRTAQRLVALLEGRGDDQ